MTSALRLATTLLLTLFVLVTAAHAQHQMPPGMTHEQHMAQMQKEAEMKAHGEQADRGGIVRIATANPEALAAVHAFLEYQIAEHATGDAVAVAGASQSTTHRAPQGAGRGTAPADHMEHRFDNAAEWAESFDDPARDEWQMPARVMEALQLTPGIKVADIGAGTGYFTMRLAKSPAAPTVFAVDIEKGMVEHIQQRAMHDGLKNIVGVLAASDRTNLPEPVDLVLMVDTYHHIPNRVAFFTALKARMKPGARLTIIDFRKDSPAGPPVEFRLTSEQIGAELAKAGFALQTTHEFLPRQMFLVYRVN